MILLVVSVPGFQLAFEMFYHRYTLHISGHSQIWIKIYTIILAFPADIGIKPASPARGSWQRIYPPVRTGFAGDAYTPANETARLERYVAAGSIDISRSGVYIYKIDDLIGLICKLSALTSYSI